MFPGNKAMGYTALHDLVEYLLEEISFMETLMPVLGKGGMVWNLVLKAQPHEPAVADVHFDFFTEPAFGGYPVEIADEEHSEKDFGINGGTAGMAVEMPDLASDKAKMNMLVHEPQQVAFRYQFLHPDIVEHRLVSAVFS